MKNLELKIKKSRYLSTQTGMTYVELIVVLAIFALITAVIAYNYRGFQSKVDIKNLGSDVALKIVEAQKSSLSGLLPPPGFSAILDWKPSYGVYFDITIIPKQFIYFVDLNNINGYEAGETLDTILITKNNSISRIDKCTDANCSLPSPINPLSITFKRPDSGATFTGVSLTGSDYIQITIISPTQMTSKIKVYPSGRIEVD